MILPSRAPAVLSLLCLCLITFVSVSTLRAQSPDAHPGDTTIVAFAGEPVDIAHRRASRTVLMPEGSRRFRQILMTYTITCPLGGCDPWDRIATIAISRKDEHGEEIYEIGRIATPYGRGGTWTIDVTDYRSLLSDSTTLINHIQTYIGGGRGFLVSVAFRFIAGTPDLEAYKVENLWAGLPEYGNPERPLEGVLRPIGLRIDSLAQFTKIRITTTGHGEGNTEGAAAYSRKRHDLVAGSTTFSHMLWRDDCDRTPGGEQEGPWRDPRAGYCPGAAVVPWDNDISAVAAPGALLTLDYNVEPYENHCRPGVPSCPCEDCSYGSVLHSIPYYWIESQVIYYRIPMERAAAGPVQVAEGSANGLFAIRFDFPSPAVVDLSVVDISGRRVYHHLGRQVTNQGLSLDLSSTPGVYTLKASVEGGSVYQRRITVR